jgi:isovaleryl-CoA dehydrogenase
MAQFTVPSLKFDLGETAEMIRSTVASFAQREIAPRAEEIDRSNTFPRDLWPRMGELGMLGLTVEEEDGGAGLGYTEHVLAMEEVSRASASIPRGRNAPRSTACSISWSSVATRCAPRWRAT